ncbi:MAG TPA: acylphosphatase [Chitinophagaceae bacterium]|nr:acylphosphatase [Chitinophagaceae bacterium]
MKTVRIIIKGFVQGVFYRQSTLKKAEELGIKGTVRNCEDETVEIIAMGTKEQIDALISWCWQGPPRSKVSNVTVQELSLQPFNNFSIIRH